MHRFMANVMTGLRTVTTVPLWSPVGPKSKIPKQPSGFGPFLSRSASLFSTFQTDRSIYSSGPLLQPIQAAALTLTAIIINPRLGTPSPPTAISIQAYKL